MRDKSCLSKALCLHWRCRLPSCGFIKPLCSRGAGRAAPRVLLHYITAVRWANPLLQRPYHTLAHHCCMHVISNMLVVSLHAFKQPCQHEVMQLKTRRWSKNVGASQCSSDSCLKEQETTAEHHRHQPCDGEASDFRDAGHMDTLKTGSQDHGHAVTTGNRSLCKS